MELDDSIDKINGIGPKLAEAYKKQSIFTVRDLLDYLPRRYEDYSLIIPIHQVKPGLISIKATISNLRTFNTRRGLSITEGLASDPTATIKVVWFNQRYRQASIKPNQLYYLSGIYKLSNRQFSLINPNIELDSDLTINSARIIPIYHESKSLSSIVIRKAVSQILSLAAKIEEILPKSIINSFNLLPLNQAYREIHFPKSQQSLEAATKRFQFNELFPVLLANELSRRDRLKASTYKIPFKVDIAQKFVAKLPFELTSDQRRVIWTIYQDMQKELPMNRLVEGDVGSGKTVVAVMAAVMAQAAGYRVAFMAPTELLARQHAITIAELLKPLEMEETFILLTGGMTIKDKRQAIKKANDIPNSFVVGTHSLLTSGVTWHNLALVIIDEQHRFGVDQRMSLQKQAGHLPHFLSITATPIPRSLALTIYNDLDLSQLRDKPLNRLPIVTELVSPTKINELYGKVKAELSAGRQVYVVCPYIHSKDEADKLSAEFVYQLYIQTFKNFSIGLIHGQLSSDEQTTIMSRFISGEINILVATTVIEVGVDVANASVMIIYGPERFGLAQLHQLRGRVGRGNYQSQAYLMLSDSLEPLSRLRQFANIQDGFELSELDLKLRGPGAVYGKLQHGKNHGQLLTLDDHVLVNQIKSAVEMFVNSNETMIKYKQLAKLVDEAQQIINLN